MCDKTEGFYFIGGSVVEKISERNTFIYRLNDMWRFVFEVNQNNLVIRSEILYDGWWICTEKEGSIPLDIAKDFANKIIENYKKKENEKK